MVRHAEPVSRADFVDWLELLERYLRHPAATGPVTQSVVAYVPVTRTHVAQPNDTLVALAGRYAATALDPSRCTWEAIADATFDTEGLPPQERAEVLQKALGSGPTEGFRVPVGTPVLIPEQHHAFATAAASPPGPPPWFELVMRDGWHAFTGEDAEGRQSTPRHDLPPPPLISRTRAEQRITAARQLRSRLEQAYRLPPPDR
jgi:hypothetical protein